MKNHRTDIAIQRDEKAIASASDSEQTRVEERRLHDALEDDEVLESLKRLHHELGVKQQHIDTSEIERLPTPK